MDGALIPGAWAALLPRDYPDRDYLLDGVTQGFRITTRTYDGPSVIQKNYKSATCSQHRDAVEKQIKEEVANGRYEVCGEPPTLVSALGAIPKPGGQRVRLIHDCSRPEGGAVNDYADTEHYSYQTVRDAAGLVSPGDFLAKVDLANAYRSVKVHPDDHHLTGLQWTFMGEDHPTFLRDTRAPYGARLSPLIFNRLTQAVRCIMASQGFGRVVAYLDDFLVVGSTREECQDTLGALMRLLRQLGFSINYNKVEGPTRSLTFLGVKFDTVTYTLSLPGVKVEQLKEDLQHTLTRRDINKRQLQSLVGRLSWASLVVYGGRPHIRRLINRINTLKNPCHKTRISSCMRADLQWWMENVDLFNGFTPIAEERPSTHICIDACTQGAGGYHQGQWYHVAWENWPGTDDLHINYKEVLALTPAVAVWGHLWRGKRVLVYSDNQAAVGIFNRGTAKNPFVMGALRNVFWASVVHDFRIKAIYYPGRLNVVADAASRLGSKDGWEHLHLALSNTYV